MFAEKALREMRDLLPANRQKIYDGVLQQLINHPPRERRLWLMATIRELPRIKEAKLQTVTQTLEEAA